MSTIRGRIILAFLGLTLLVSPFLIFSYTSLKKVSDSRKLREQIAFFNVTRLKLSNKFSEIQDHDTKVASFYSSEPSDNLKQLDEYILLANDALMCIDKSDDVLDRVIHSRVKLIQNDLKILNSTIHRVLQLERNRGFKNDGLEGELRENAHQLENAPGILLEENLSLRRREKDYFLRKDINYVQQLNQESDSLKSRLNANLEENVCTLELLSAYQDSFNAIVALEEEIGGPENGLIQEIHNADQDIAKEVDILYTAVSAKTELLTSSIRAYVILFFIITLIFAVIFIIVFSNYIALPIKRMIKDMAYISRQNFKGESQLSTDTPLKEIKLLKTAYNALINKIRVQVEDLSQNNVELSLLNERLTESESELKEASKLKDKFFSIISHDLRGHARNVLSLAIMMDEETDISQEEKAVLNQYMVDASHNLQLLLDNLLNWAKSQMNDHEMAKKSFDINQLIATNVKLFEENAYRKGIIVTHIESELSKAYADKDMVDFIIRNLLSNALKFTSKGDSITLSVVEEQESLTIKVKDTGTGMTPAQVNILLNSEEGGFTTIGTDNEVGTGLGFSIIKDFVKRNNGEIAINSVADEGSEFIFTLPTSLNVQILSA